MSCKCWLCTVYIRGTNRVVQSIVFVLNKTGPSLMSWVAQLYPTHSSPAGVVRVITLPPPPPLYPLIFPASLSPFSWAFFTSLHLASHIDDLGILSHIPFLTTWTKRKSRWETTLRLILHWRRGSPKAPTTGENCCPDITDTQGTHRKYLFSEEDYKSVIVLQLFVGWKWYKIKQIWVYWDAILMVKIL